MKNEPKTLLAARLLELHCTRVPEWVQARLLPLVEAEARIIETKAEDQLQRHVSRAITIKTVATAFAAGPLPPIGEGSKGEATPPLLPTVFKA